LEHCNSVKNDPISKNKKPLYSSQYQLQHSLEQKNRLPFKNGRHAEISKVAPSTIKLI